MGWSDADKGLLVGKESTSRTGARTGTRTGTSEF